MDSIFVVSAGVDYEGSTPIRAFDAEDEAEEFAEVCRQYESTRPRFDPKADQAAIEVWSAADKAWRLAHPGGENADGADYFAVREIPFGARPSPPREKQ